MFAYCENNPIIGIDPTGEFAWLIGAVAGAAVNVATSVITQLHDGGNVDIGKVVVSGICGAVAGAGLPKVGGAIVGAATSLIDNISSNWGDASLTTGEKILDAVVATGFGALTGAMGSSVNAIKLDSAVSTVKSATKVLVNGGRKLFKKQAKKGLRKAGKYIGKSFFTYLAENSIYSGLAWGTSKYARASYRSFRR